MSSSEGRPGIAERVGKALARGDMRQYSRAGRILYGADIDTVGALGLVGIQEPLADAIFRLKNANDPRSYDGALAGVCRLARSLNTRQRWRYNRKRLAWMARSVLDYWLMDGCPACTGLGYEVIPGTPHLSDRPCQACHGSRKRAMPWLRELPKRPEGRKDTRAYRKLWYTVCGRIGNSITRHRLLLVELETVERRVAEKMRERLARAA